VGKAPGLPLGLGLEEGVGRPEGVADGETTEKEGEADGVRVSGLPLEAPG
jgi:hypothetical protein